MRSGDTLVITKLDRLGRTTKPLIELSQHLEDNGIDLEIIDMNINMKDAIGKMFFTMLRGFAELEASLLNERTKKGLEFVQSRGRVGGRPRITQEKVNVIVSLYHSKTDTINEIVKMAGVSKGTIYNVINQDKLNTQQDMMLIRYARIGSIRRIEMR